MAFFLQQFQNSRFLFNIELTYVCIRSDVLQVNSGVKYCMLLK